MVIVRLAANPHFLAVRLAAIFIISILHFYLSENDV